MSQSPFLRCSVTLFQSYFTTNHGHWQRYVKIYVISADVNDGEVCDDGTGYGDSDV